MNEGARWSGWDKQSSRRAGLLGGMGYPLICLASTWLCTYGTSFRLYFKGYIEGALVIQER